MKKSFLSNLHTIKKELKPFFNFSVNDWQDVVSLILGGILVVIIFFQAYFLELNYDEAYTYLNTGRWDNVWQIYQFRIANTHFLNSLLMSVTTLFFPYNDVAIRLPAILFGLFYVAISISLAKQFRNKLLLLGLLFFFYFFTLYLSMARGYGMSATCVLAMVFVYKNQAEFKNWFLTFSIFGLLALYGNYIAIPIISVFGAYIFVVDFKFKLPPVTKKSLYWLIGIFLLGVWGFISVTKAGKPLYGAFDKSFIEAISLDWLARFIGGYDTSVYEISNKLGFLVKIAGIISAAFGIGILGTYIFGKKQNVVGMVTLLSLFLIFVISTVGSKPLPTGRVLIPFWPLIVVSLLEIIEYATWRLNKRIIYLVNVGFLVALSFNYFGHFSKFWSASFANAKEFRALSFVKNYEFEGNPSEVYFADKILKDGDLGIRPEDFYYLAQERRREKIIDYLSKNTPNEQFIFKNSTIRVFIAKRIFSVGLNNPNTMDSVKITLYSNKDLVFEKKVVLSSGKTVNNKFKQLLLPFPVLPKTDYLVFESLTDNRSYEYFLE